MGQWSISNKLPFIHQPENQNFDSAANNDISVLYKQHKITNVIWTVSYTPAYRTSLSDRTMLGKMYRWIGGKPVFSLQAGFAWSKSQLTHRLSDLCPHLFVIQSCLHWGSVLHLLGQPAITGTGQMLLLHGGSNAYRSGLLVLQHVSEALEVGGKRGRE